MIEVIAFVAFGIALAALLNGRKTTERLDTEIAALKDEMKRVGELRAAPVATEAVEAPAEVEAADSAPQPVDPAPLETPRAAQIRKGDAIFGGPPPSQDAVERPRVANRWPPARVQRAP
ncbi:hypothetical protein LP421_12145 [Rhizobium sp. RCAM05350]|nr:hypothetical protein LP421_12145 [Rhizobium sp. RCAM05350]